MSELEKYGLTPQDLAEHGKKGGASKVSKTFGFFVGGFVGLVASLLNFVIPQASIFGYVIAFLLLNGIIFFASGKGWDELISQDLGLLAMGFVGYFLGIFLGSFIIVLSAAIFKVSLF